jgi:endonuclease/exonuclease/phosphatase family metal-dependent hydrolase
MSGATYGHSVNLLAWNIKSGGFNEYNQTQSFPEREAPIQEAIANFHQDGIIDTVSLIDAYRWDELYVSEAGIAKHLGYQQARFTQLHDQRLEKIFGPGLGIVFATDKPIEQARQLDLGNRVGLGIILGIGKYGLQIANVYLDDLNEEVRVNQVKSLMNDLEPDLPTLIVGDLNTLRPNMKGANLGVKTQDLVVRSLAHILPRRSWLGIAVRGMNERQVIPVLESNGFRDADDVLKRPTVHARFPIFGVDYAFHNDQVTIGGFQVVSPRNGASDHRAILFNAQVAA